MPLKLAAHTSATAKGRRPYQEDQVFAASYPQGLLLGVFDGHGGARCAIKASEGFLAVFADEIGEPGATPESAYKKTFARVNAETCRMQDGTSASVAFVPWSADRVWVAVLGDSPVIVKRADGSVWNAPEHNVRTNKAEAEAAIARGGGVYDGYLYNLKNKRGSIFGAPGLQMARAFGDAALHEVLDRTPEIFEHVLGAGSFVLVASDGALDPGHGDVEGAAKAVVELIQSGSDAQAVVNRAVSVPTGDNVSAVLVRVEG